MADNYVECKNVNYKYVNSESAKNVLNDATLSVEKGSFTAIIGRNDILKGVGRHPKSGKKKGDMKVHTVMKYHVGVPISVDRKSVV